MGHVLIIQAPLRKTLVRRSALSVDKPNGVRRVRRALLAWDDVMVKRNSLNPVIPAGSHSHSQRVAPMKICGLPEGGYA